MTPAVEPNSSTTTAEIAEQVEQRLGFRHNQHVVHDLADFHLADLYLRNAHHRDHGTGRSQTQARPAHEVFGVKHSDNVFGAALRIIDRNARVLIVDHARQRFVEREVGGQRENSRPRHHHLPGGDVVEFERVEQHFFLRGRKLA